LRVESATSAVVSAVRDWHADLFAVGDDSDAGTSRSTPLDERIARQFEKAGIPAERRGVPASAAEGAWPPPAGEVAPPVPLIQRVRTFNDKSIGNLLHSEDNKASLVVVELATEFLIRGNREIIHKIEELVGGLEPARQGGAAPGTAAGLPASISLSAGRRRSAATCGSTPRRAPTPRTSGRWCWSWCCCC
jgi:hypothetical protein